MANFSETNAAPTGFNWAEEQARLMLQYNNTPPLFITSTRDFFLDLARQQPGSKLTTLQAHDIDGDPLEYSLEKADPPDASAHFAINQTSGELRLAGQPFEQANKEAYFLNVIANDGHYVSKVQLRVHLTNSSAQSQAADVGGPAKRLARPPKPRPHTSQRPARNSTRSAPIANAQVQRTTLPIEPKPLINPSVRPSEDQADLTSRALEPTASSPLELNGLVFTCAGLLGLLLLFMLAIWCSVSRIRRRLKQVERQRQLYSSSNSTAFTPTTLASQQQQHHLNTSWLSSLPHVISCDQLQRAQWQAKQRSTEPDENLYCPIDDDNNELFQRADSLYENSAGSPHLAHLAGSASSQQVEFANSAAKQLSSSSRASTDSQSGSSTRSLVQFLSLGGGQQPREKCEVRVKPADWEIRKESSAQMSSWAQKSQTIARSFDLASLANQKPFTCASATYNAHAWELDRHKLFQPSKLLGEGQFGQVWRYKLRAEPHDQVVAVKSLKSSAARDESAREEFLAEIEIMKLLLRHPNVIRLLHCCTRDALQGENPILLVMEYAELGKLQSLLEKSRPERLSPTPLGLASERVTARDLLKFIYHVAKGMEHVSRHNIVHRDLASRNVLVSAQGVCKVADFGMARRMETFGEVYECRSRNAKIPVRWMAPEVLLSNRFTTESDVFSFGILMWEIVTLGSTPYWHLKTEQVKEAVARRGERPAKPEQCHELLYNMMARCWAQEAHLRPSFSCLVNQLDELLLSSNNYIELDQGDYYNIPITEAPYELL